MRVVALAVAIAGLLAGCAAPPRSIPAPGPAVPEPAADTCAAAPYARLIGQDATALERELIMRQIRVIRPGMPETMDFSAERINFEIGPTNRIDRIFCG